MRLTRTAALAVAGMCRLRLWLPLARPQLRRTSAVQVALVTFFGPCALSAFRGTRALRPARLGDHRERDILRPQSRNRPPLRSDQGKALASTSSTGWPQTSEYRSLSLMPDPLLFFTGSGRPYAAHVPWLHKTNVVSNHSLSLATMAGHLRDFIALLTARQNQ